MPKHTSTVTVPEFTEQVAASMRALLSGEVTTDGTLVTVDVPDGVDPEKHADALIDVATAILTNIKRDRGLL